MLLNTVCVGIFGALLLDRHSVYLPLPCGCPPGSLAPQCPRILSPLLLHPFAGGPSEVSRARGKSTLLQVASQGDFCSCLPASLPIPLCTALLPLPPFKYRHSHHRRLFIPYRETSAQKEPELNPLSCFILGLIQQAKSCYFFPSFSHLHFTL